MGKEKDEGPPAPGGKAIFARLKILSIFCVWHDMYASAGGLGVRVCVCVCGYCLGEECVGKVC